MGLDVSLLFDVDTGGAYHCTEVYAGAVTHNLVPMAQCAGIYDSVWRPDENGITHAWQMVEPLKKGCEKLKADPENFRHLAPENGWGTYEGLVEFVEKYLNACKDYPKARVSVWR